MSTLAPSHTAIFRKLLIAGLLGLIAIGALDIYLFSSYLESNTLNTLYICGLAYLATGFLIERLLFVPPIEGNAIILTTSTLGFLMAVMLLKIGHAPISKVSIVLSYGFTVFWYRISYSRHLHTSRLRLVFLNQHAQEHFFNYSQYHASPHRTLLIDFANIEQTSLQEHDILVWDPDLTTEATPLKKLKPHELSQLKILSVDRAIELITGRLSLAHIHREFTDLPNHPLYDLIKRVIDWVGAFLLLLILSPLLISVGMAIACFNGRPIFFQQKRVGLNGEIFSILKFRTMQNSQQSRFTRPKHDTHRITRLGQWLRHHRIDELPQLYNVIKGDMSLIGPRPEYAGYARLFRQQIPHYAFRHLVKPGITGWAQVQQGHNTGPLEATIKLTYDLYYVKHYSLILDLLIAFKTLRIVITGFGAR